MASIYDKIKTPKELLQLVSHQGLSTEPEDICRAQDIFGRASVGELVELANDNGRKNSNGEKDPRGSWADGSRGLSATFYSVLFHIWSWEDATRFYNEHSNFVLIDRMEELKTLKAEREKNEQIALNAMNDVKTRIEEEKKMAAAIADLKESVREKDYENERLKDEILRLKAKLYDMMVERS